jgi:competence protein CoiA
MKYALVDGQRREPETGLKGICQGCDLPMTPRCGQQRVHHWAHRTANCDKWWERETVWHREWKNKFPVERQEIRISSPTGDFHVADVQTPNGTVLEFQHSHLPLADRQARESFYVNMAWVVDGRRRASDFAAFAHSLSFAAPDYGNVRAWRLPLVRCAIAENWSTALSTVYLDFGATYFPVSAGPSVSHKELPSSDILWRVTKARNGRIVITPFLRQSVIDHYMCGTSLGGFDPHPRPTDGLWDHRSLD